MVFFYSNGTLAVLTGKRAPTLRIRASKPTEPRGAGIQSTPIRHQPVTVHPLCLREAMLWRPKFREQLVHRSYELLWLGKTVGGA